MPNPADWVAAWAIAVSIGVACGWFDDEEEPELAPEANVWFTCSEGPEEQPARTEGATMQITVAPSQTVDVKFVKRTYGGYNVVNRLTGHELGWVIQNADREWEARAGRRPFLPADADAVAVLKADLPRGATGESGPGHYLPVYTEEKREWAAEGLVGHLVRWNAEAVR